MKKAILISRQIMLRKKPPPIFDAPPPKCSRYYATKRNYNVSILLDTSPDPLEIINNLSDNDELNSTYIFMYNLELDLLTLIISNPREFDLANRVRVEGEA